MDLLKDIQPEDIEDVTDRFIPMFTEERDADVVKQVHIPGGEDIFIALIEHKSDVDYNVIMQILRYMVYIWEDYEKRKEQEYKGITATKDFKYPPILPIVYFEGKNWNAALKLSDRIALSDAFRMYIPDFKYHLIRLGKYNRNELIDKNDQLSFVMLINKIRSAKEFKQLKLELSDEYVEKLFEQSSDDVVDVISRVVAVVLRKQNLPENEIGDLVDKIKRREPMALFDNYKGFDVQEERRKGERKGERTGERTGERKMLISLICAKLAKGKSSKVIAMEVEKSVSFVNKIKKVAMKYAPNYDVQLIFEELYLSKK